jgi:ergothioneine biosynthesis protein EgtB
MIKFLLSNKELENSLFLNNENLSPIKWKLGNILFFWQKYIFSFLIVDLDFKIPDYYDYFTTNFSDRFDYYLIDTFNILNYIDNLYDKLITYILSNNNLSSFDSYLLRLGNLYQNNSNESLIIIFNFLKKNPLSLKVNISSYNILDINPMIFVPGGIFRQGSSDIFYFDNEVPSFLNKVNNFKISKYCITNYQFLKFINFGGYSNVDFWSNSGWKWIKKYNIKSPIYWKYDNVKNIWKENIFGKYCKLKLNNPITHINYYEASAFCKWLGCRLPKESEWEYLTTFFYNDYKNNSNFDINKGVISVLDDKNINNLGITGLYGNVWELCLEPFYPYDGFKIDPIYREISYPYFGRKRICRGGSWCSSEYMITKSFRNFIDISKRSEYISFRVVKDI